MLSLCILQEIADKYPPWLDKHKGGGGGAVDPEALVRYEQQYRCICNLLKVYEEDPGNYQQIMTLLQEVSEGAMLGPSVCLLWSAPLEGLGKPGRADISCGGPFMMRPNLEWRPAFRLIITRRTCNSCICTCGTLAVVTPCPIQQSCWKRYMYKGGW